MNMPVGGSGGTNGGLIWGAVGRTAHADTETQLDAALRAAVSVSGKDALESRVPCCTIDEYSCRISQVVVALIVAVACLVFAATLAAAPLTLATGIKLAISVSVAILASAYAANLIRSRGCCPLLTPEQQKQAQDAAIAAAGDDGL